MTSSRDSVSGYRFGDITVDVERRRVSRGRDTIRLGKLTYELLVALAASAPGVVTREELVERLWDGRYVSPETVKQRVKLLRQALSDEADNPRYIRVVRGQGYRLIPDVEPLTSDTSQPTWKRAHFLASAAALAGIAVVSWIYWSNPDSADVDEILTNSIAVLPFENLSPDLDNAYFAAGIHEEVLNQLAKLREVSVISRTSVMRYADSDLSIPEIADELNVGTVLEGSVRYASDRVRITAQLVDAATDEHLWSEVYERDFADIFAIQTDIATNIANALEIELSLAERESIEALPTSSLGAYAAYLRALQRGFPSVPDLNRAIELDPEFALAYAARGWWYAAMLLFGNEVPFAEYERNAVADAERALALDPTIGVAYGALAAIDDVNGRWAEALRKAELAYRLSPNDGAVLNQYIVFMRSTGEYDESVRANEHWTRIDPTRGIAYQQLTATHRYAGNYDAAVSAARKAIEINPADPALYVHLASAEAARGNHDEALTGLQTAEEIFGGEYRPVFRVGQMAIVYSQIGRHEDVERMFALVEELDRERPVGEAIWAMAHIALANYEEALEHVTAAVENLASVNGRALNAIKANPWKIPELDTPRFQEVLDGFWSVE